MTVILRQVVFGLGSNLGDRVANVISGATSLARCVGVHGIRLSPLYETKPVGGPPQDDFINAALVIQTEQPARWLLETALSIEKRHGRIRLERYGPRTLDIDILWIDQETIDEPGLQVPHPRLLQRAFALRPLLDVAPRAEDPRTHENLAMAMGALSNVGMRLHLRAGTVTLGHFAREGHLPSYVSAS